MVSDFHVQKKSMVPDLHVQKKSMDPDVHVQKKIIKFPDFGHKKKQLIFLVSKISRIVFFQSRHELINT